VEFVPLVASVVAVTLGVFLVVSSGVYQPADQAVSALESVLPDGAGSAESGGAQQSPTPSAGSAGAGSGGTPPTGSGESGGGSSGAGASAGGASGASGGGAAGGGATANGSAASPDGKQADDATQEGGVEGAIDPAAGETQSPER